MIRIAALWLLLAFGAAPTRADSTSPTAPTNYVADIISNRIIYAIAEDPHGAMWLGGFGELYRYNGIALLPATTRRPHSFPATSIASLASLDDGTLWIGIGGGV